MESYEYLSHTDENGCRVEVTAFGDCGRLAGFEVEIEDNAGNKATLSLDWNGDIISKTATTTEEIQETIEGVWGFTPVSDWIEERISEEEAMRGPYIPAWMD